jgi:hypothetical protein
MALNLISFLFFYVQISVDLSALVQQLWRDNNKDSNDVPEVAMDYLETPVLSN